tara:strand:+ start:274 stop:444 length:171 start_codon:yes stop_codon:yes gene_type:complete
MGTMDGETAVEHLKQEVDELKSLVTTLINVILEEADGVASGAAPKHPAHPRLGYCM